MMEILLRSGAAVTIPIIVIIGVVEAGFVQNHKKRQVFCAEVQKLSLDEADVLQKCNKLCCKVATNILPKLPE